MIVILRETASQPQVTCVTGKLRSSGVWGMWRISLGRAEDLSRSADLNYRSASRLTTHFSRKECPDAEDRKLADWNWMLLCDGRPVFPAGSFWSPPGKHNAQCWSHAVVRRNGACRQWFLLESSILSTRGAGDRKGRKEGRTEALQVL